MALTEKEADELELLRLKRRKFELEAQVMGQETIPPERRAEFQAIKAGGITDPQVVSTPESEGLNLADAPVGALAGGTIGASVGGVPGAVLGAAGGEAVEQNVKRGANKFLGTDFDVPQSGVEAGKDIVIEGGLALIGEGAPRIVLNGGARLLSGFSKRVPAEARQAIQFLEENMPSVERGKFNPLRYIYGKNTKPIGLLPAEATDDKFLDIIHNVSEKSIIGGQGLQDFKLNRTKFFKDYADDFVDSFGTHIDEIDETSIGDLFVSTVEDRLKPSRTLASAFYNTTDDLTRGRIVIDPVTLKERVVDAAKVSTKSLKAFAKTQLATIDAAQGLGSAESGDSIIKSILAMNDEVSFTVAKNIRTRLRAAADGFAVVNKKAPAIGKAKKLGSMLDESIETGLKAYKNPEALKTWRMGNKFYRDGSKEFDNVFLRRLIKNADPDASGKFPETIVKGVFKPNNIGGIRITKKALGGGDSVAWKKMQGWHAKDILLKGTTDGKLNGTKLQEAMFGRTGVGEKAMREIYSDSQVKGLKEFANAIVESQASQSSGGGGMIIQLAQGGALFQVATGTGGAAGFGGSGLILFGPSVLARAITNPRIVRTIVNGVKAGNKTKIAAGAMGRFITDVVNMEDRRNSDREEAANAR